VSQITAFRVLLQFKDRTRTAYQAKQRAAVRPERAYRYTLLQPDCTSPTGQGQKSIMFTHSRILDKDIVRASYRKHENRLVKRNCRPSITSKVPVATTKTQERLARTLIHTRPQDAFA
jgi:hypothetical protein